MKRRDVLKALIAFPVVAVLPEPGKAAEELMDGITYIQQSNFCPVSNVWLTEYWSRMDGKIWRLVTGESKIISLTEEPFCPFVQWTMGRNEVEL